jgi:hypothetical protein
MTYVGTLKPWNEADIRDRKRPRPRKRSTKPSALAAVTVAYNGIGREVLYKPTTIVYALLGDAVRAHGLKFANCSHLRLHRLGAELDHATTAKRAGIEAGTRLTLQQPLAPEKAAADAR